MKDLPVRRGMVLESGECVGDPWAGAEDECFAVKGAFGRLNAITAFDGVPARHAASGGDRGPQTLCLPQAELRCIALASHSPPRARNSLPRPLQNRKPGSVIASGGHPVAHVGYDAGWLHRRLSGGNLHFRGPAASHAYLQKPIHRRYAASVFGPEIPVSAKWHENVEPRGT